MQQAGTQIAEARAAAAQALRPAGQTPDHPAERLVLVVHSGAGVFAPYFVAGLADARVAVIFADAALPPEHGQGRVIDEEFLPFVRDLSDDGLVPPWPQWWPAAELDPLFPDQATRERVTREAPPLPLDFFEEALPPVPEDWQQGRHAFLRFSEAYQELARQAAARGWPVRDLPGGHLHMLVAPAAVADAISGLASTLQTS